MSAICLIDTSVFLEVLRVPGCFDESRGVLEVLEAKVKAKETLLLPVTTIFETGNHIGRVEGGHRRRTAAERFRNQVLRALQGELPFVPTPPIKLDDLGRWLEGFPDWTKQPSGLGDFTLVKEWERQCEKNPSRCVYVWSFDRHLQSYDRKPRL